MKKIKNICLKLFFLIFSDRCPNIENNFKKIKNILF